MVIMIRCLVTLLSCVVAVEAARYGDYSGARMPHYSVEYENKDPAPLTDEYLDRSPDAAASFDYKYEEEPRVKINNRDQDDVWLKTNNKRKRPFKSTDSIEIDEDENDFISTLRPNHRYKKHRTRIKDLYKESDKKHFQHDRISDDNVDDIDDSKNEFNINKDRSRSRNRIDFENFNFRDITKRAARRKPRDRTINHENLDNDDVRNVQLNMKGKEIDEDSVEIDYERGRNRESNLDGPHLPFSSLSKINHKNYPEYDGYYDMKRVNNMKNKLPGLFRQTKASTRMMTSPSVRRLQDITYRRANPPEKNTEIKFDTDTSSTTSKYVITSVIFINRTEYTEQSTSTNSTDLSLAEKSRLSILKKSQKKESSRNTTWTTKPPVLMQVTRQMQTLVMVEPPNENVNLRARAVFDESPERISRAKTLMRRKLVAGARSINDLIDNWDEMVCDYIDTSLLNNANPHVHCNLKIILLSVITCLISRGFV